MFRSIMLSAVIACAALPGQAEIEPLELATCMRTHTTPEIKADMKEFLVFALQEKKAEATSSLLSFSFAAFSIATANCGMSFGDVEHPNFDVAMETYGQMLGEDIMNDAFRILDIPVD